MNKLKTIKLFIDAEVIVFPHFSGIGHYTASLLKALDDLLDYDEYSHIKVTLGVPRKDKHKLGRFEYRNFGIKNYPISTRRINGLKRRSWLPPIDSLFGRQTYIFPNYSSWPTLFSKSIPIIYDLSFVKYPQFGDSANVTFLTKQVELSAKRASRIITISTNSKKEITEHYKYSANKIDIVYPIIDTRTFYKRSEIEVKKVKAKYGIFDDYILFVGNLEPRKNIVSLLEAYEMMPKNIRDKYALLLVGAKGWNNGAIHEKIQSMRMNGYKILQPTDYVIDEDMPALITGADAFAYVSVYEGFGIPPVEAMACGTVSIASNNSSLPEACGDAAIYVEATSAKQIAVALEKALTHDNDKIIEAGLLQANKFDAKSAALNLIKCLEKVDS